MESNTSNAKLGRSSYASARRYLFKEAENHTVLERIRWRDSGGKCLRMKAHQ